MTLALATRALAHLDLQDVDTTEEDNMFFVGSPAMRAYLMQIPEFQKADYVEIKPLVGPVRRFGLLLYDCVSITCALQP